jgi:hypothetical protein
MAETEKFSEVTKVTTLDSGASIPLFDANGSITGITATNFKKEVLNGSAVSDVDYVIGQTSSGEQVKISKADLASVVGGLILGGGKFKIATSTANVFLGMLQVFFLILDQSNNGRYYLGVAQRSSTSNDFSWSSLASKTITISYINSYGTPVLTNCDSPLIMLIKLA